MITQTNIKDTLGASLPQVYFNSFTLSNGGDVRKSVQDPHIEHPNETSVASLNEIEDTLKNKSLYVNINLILKETVNQDSSLMFLTNGDILKYVKIGVVQCRDKAKHNAIVNDPIKWLKVGGYLDMNGHSTNGINRKIISLNETTLGALKTITIGENESGEEKSDASSIISQMPYARNQDSEGNIVFDIGLYTDFVIGPSEGGASVSFLSYFAYAYFDLDEFIIDDGEFGKVSIPSEIMDILSVGQVSSDIVIKQKNVNKISYIFLDQNNKYWLGDVHQMDDGKWMKGNFHSNSANQSDYLDKIQVPNEKIVDNREIINIEQINLDYTKFSNYLSNDEALISLMKKSKTDILLKKKPQLFSELYLTRDKSNNARFMFTVNMHEAVKQNTIFPALLDIIKQTDKKEYTKIISSAKIYNFKLYRQRVRKQEMMQSDIQRTSFSTTDPRILLINSKDVSGVLASVSKGTSSLEEIWYQIENNLGLRSFSGIDFDISRQLDGVYEYSIEIEMSDPIPDFISNKISELIVLVNGTQSKNGLQGYFQDATSDPSNYDTYTNRFTLQFYDFYEENYSNSWLAGSIFKYVHTLMLMSGNSSEFNSDAVNLLSYLVKISNPNSGSPDGIQLVIKLIEGFISKLNSVLSLTTSYQKNAPNLPSDAYGKTPNLTTGKSTRNFSIEHDFKSLYNAAIPKTYGIEYLSIDPRKNEDNYGGIVAISSNALKKRAKLESKKYFKGSNIDISITDSDESDAIQFNPGDSVRNKMYTFLTPSFVRVPQRTTRSILANGSLKQSFPELNDLVLDIARYNVRNSSIGTQATSNTIKNNKITPNNQKRRFDIVNFFAEKGCTFKVQKKLPSNINTPVSNTTANTVIGLGNIDDGDNLYESPDKNTSAVSQDIFDSFIDPNNLLSALLQIDDLDLLDDRNSMDFYKIRKSDGGKTFKDELFAYGLLALAQSALEGEVTLQTPLTRAPNQLKAFILSLMKSSSVKKIAMFDEATPEKDPKYDDLTQGQKKKLVNEGNFNPTPPPKDIMRDPNKFGFIYFNYRNIRRIEVLRSYGMVDDSIFVGQPIWTDLQEEDLTSLYGSSIVCRHKQYFNTNQGSLHISELSMPTYNEYFILTRDSQLVDVSINNTNTQSQAGVPSYLQPGTPPPATLTQKQDYGGDGEDIGPSARKFSDFKLQRDKYMEQRVLNFEPPRQGAPRGIVRNEFLRSTSVSTKRNIKDTGIDVDRNAAIAKVSKFDSLSKSEKSKILKDLGLDKHNQDKSTVPTTGAPKLPTGGSLY